MTDAPAQLVYSRPKSLTDTPTHYCPGCTHGVAHRLIAEVLDEMDLREKTIGVAPVGCSVFAYNYFDCDFVEAAHGRAPAMATGIKRVLPDRIVFTYQGDGDLASIGMAEIMHAGGARREHHRHLHQQCHLWHDRRADGSHHPARPEDHLFAQRPGCGADRLPHPHGGSAGHHGRRGLLVRRSLHDPKNIRLAKKAIRMAFEVQRHGLGFSMVELLSTCPTNWGLTPQQSLKWVEEHMVPVFPLGDYKVSPAVAGIKI